MKNIIAPVCFNLYDSIQLKWKLSVWEALQIQGYKIVQITREKADILSSIKIKEI